MNQFIAMLETKTGVILVSVILGLGLSAIFRKACKDNRCIVIKGPPMKDIQQFTYKLDDQCFKYTPVVTDCKESSEGEHQPLQTSA